jgi:endonuclease I
MFRKSILCVAIFAAFFNYKVYAQGYEVPQISIFPDLTGNELLEAVANAYRPNQVYSYNDSRDYMFSQTHNLDGVVYCLYTNDVILIPYNDPSPRTIANNHNPTWNTEHVYPQSKGASAQPAQSDLHHLFPTRSDVNSSRGNLPFGLVPNNQVSRWWRENVSQTTQPAGDLGEWSKTSGSVRFEPRDVSKGDVARAVFYFYTMYKAQAEAADPVFFQLMYEDLRVFHNMDPVDSLEYHRTLAIGNIQSHQGNPFILDTTLVTRMFFSGDIEFENEIEEGDYLANFEIESKGSYAAAPVSLSGVTWNLDNVLIGNLAADLKIGARSARLRHNTSTPGTMEMLDLLPGGIGTISFVYGLYQSDLDPTSPTFVVEYTTDASSGSASWTQIGSTTNLAGVNTLKEFRFDLQEPSPARIRIRSTSGTDGRRFNIDNIFITRVVEQSLNQSIEGLPGWRMLASPTQSTTFADLLEGTFFTQGFPGTDAPSETYDSNVILYNETTGQFESPANINDQIATAQGFALWVYPDEASGTTVQKSLTRIGFENAEKSVQLSFSSEGGHGWNLVGNPFSAPYPVSALGISAADINQNLYVWDANLDDYVIYSAIDQAATIAPFQSFFVKAESAGQTLNFNRNERSEGGVFHKTPSGTDAPISEITNSTALPLQLTLTWAISPET